jgi:hypothetical protein
LWMLNMSFVLWTEEVVYTITQPASMGNGDSSCSDHRWLHNQTACVLKGLLHYGSLTITTRNWCWNPGTGVKFHYTILVYWKAFYTTEASRSRQEIGAETQEQGLSFTTQYRCTERPSTLWKPHDHDKKACNTGSCFWSAWCQFPWGNASTVIDVPLHACKSTRIQ